MKKYFADIIESIQQSFAGLDEERFTALLADCEGVIRSGGKIVASGLGKNVPICEKFVGMMNSLGARERIFAHKHSNAWRFGAYKKQRYCAYFEQERQHR